MRYTTTEVRRSRWCSKCSRLLSTQSARCAQCPI